MEVPEMEEGKSKSHLTSPAAFVEGGIQEACDDSCSICLEAFCDSDPSTVTSCRHEFHLQCILEWCQRSSNCPMCWQAISLKDPTSQELLEAVEQERSVRFNLSRNSTIYRHPTLGDFELQHLPVGANDGGLEDRIIQHLAAAAAMGRTHHRREGSRTRSLAHGRPQFVVFSAHPNAPSAATDGSGGVEAEPAAISLASPSVPNGVETVHPISTPGTSNVSNHQGTSVIHRSSSSQSYLHNQDRAGPSDFQTVSDWKSRFNALSMRYRESFSKSTRGWKERLFNRSSSMSNLGSEIRTEVQENNHDHDSTSSNVGDESLAAAEESNRTRVNNNLDDDNNTGSANGATAPSN